MYGVMRSIVMHEARPKAGNIGAFWEQQSTYLTLQPCHREQNTEERKGYKMQDRAAGLHKGLGVEEPWPASAGPEQQRECWEWNQRGPKWNIHLGGGKERERLLQSSGGWWRQTGECSEHVEGRRVTVTREKESAVWGQELEWEGREICEETGVCA